MKQAPIKVEMFFTPQLLDERQLKDKNVVIIDVLRSSTTIATALQNGAREVIPMKNIDNVLKISSGLDAKVTLRGGERQGRMIEGFNLGNSPSEYSEAAVRGKSVIMLTTNGTPAMVNARNALNLFIAGFVNLSLVVAAVMELKSDFTIVCSGKENNFCIEDSICAGKIINRMVKESSIDVQLDDAAAAAVALDKAFGKNILKMLQNSDHGKYLQEIGFGADLKTCSRIDAIPVLPVLSGGVIRLNKPAPAAAAGM